MSQNDEHNDGFLPGPANDAAAADANPTPVLNIMTPGTVKMAKFTGSTHTQTDRHTQAKT